MMNFASVPLTQSQRGVYFECREKPKSTQYNLAFTLLLPEKINLDRFKVALQRVVSLHPALFATFRLAEDGPVMVQGEIRPVKFKESSAESREDAERDFVRPFDLEKGPLYRFEFCRLPEGVLFLFDIHHLIFDGLSLKLFLQQIERAYLGEKSLCEDFTLFDEARDEKTLMNSADYKAAQDFFSKEFSNVEVSNNLLADVAHPEKEEGMDALVTKAPKDLDLKRLERFAKEAGVTIGTVFMGAFAYTLCVFENSNECTFTTASGGRHRGADKHGGDVC